MHSFSFVAASLGLLIGATSAQVVSEWGQCGGINHTGPTACVSGSGCVKINDYYYQCQPGAAAPTTAPAPSTTLRTSTRASTAPTTSSTSSPPPAGTGPGTTLQTGYYWIRGVTVPYFHKYMQSSPLYSASIGYLKDYTTAGQFQVVDGQLVQLVSAPGAPAQLLYGIVNPEKKYGQALALSFSTTKNTYGTFGWQGDGLTWTHPQITRPNISAWYACENDALYINLGNYNYQTPAGCADQTIHYYNDSKANNKREAVSEEA